MPYQCANPKELYAADSNIKQEDVKILEEWLSKQPHLPQLNETQVIIFLHSCYYRIEAAKTAIDNYFTSRTLCPDLFVALTPDILRKTASTAFLKILPKKTPEGYILYMMKLIDFKTDNFNCTEIINLIIMVGILHLHQYPCPEGAVAVFDMKGFGLGHITRLNLNMIKHALYYLQEGVPVRIKGIHVINAVSLIDKVVALLKPFLSSELYNMLTFHPPGSDTLYKSVPKECLPEEYGGKAPSCQILNEENVNNIMDNYDFFKWHDSQTVDESKRIGKRKTVNDVFGMEGTFKKLELD